MAFRRFSDSASSAAGRSAEAGQRPQNRTERRMFIQEMGRVNGPCRLRYGPFTVRWKENAGGCIETGLTFSCGVVFRPCAGAFPARKKTVAGRIFCRHGRRPCCGKRPGRSASVFFPEDMPEKSVCASSLSGSDGSVREEPPPSAPFRLAPGLCGTEAFSKERCREKPCRFSAGGRYDTVFCRDFCLCRRGVGV